MASIYLVGEGEYSDQEIVAAFLSEERANYVASFKCYRWVQEIEIDKIPENLGTSKYLAATFDKNGQYVKIDGDWESKMKRENVLSDLWDNDVLRNKNRYASEGYIVRVPVSDNYEKMKKIACDKLAEYRATVEGIS